MKKLSLASLIIGAIFFSACNGNPNSGSTQSNNTLIDKSKAISSSSDTARMALVSDDAKDFSKEVAQNCMMEEQLGSIAVKNGGTERIKDFGKMMVVNYTKISDDLKYLASKKNVVLPTSNSDDQQQNIDKLSKEIGKKFDEDYVSMMITDYKANIATFKKAENNISDIGYKSFISNALPILQNDLDAIEAIKKEM
ncbi:MAG TPA: DUF4142 domain-containing protein [Hanamia sp.]|nr:DUF4142 domain-containing protein [Hanamia sp.]